ncbi:MAG: ABC transporter substrate-binding protein [Bacteroidota bacterium]|nr:ABC transporter substrate-binding protein [Bacteroidota bacterium]
MRYCILLVSLIFLGCGRPATTESRSVFRYNQSEGITSLDPAFARNIENMWACDQIFDGLIEMGPDLLVRPGIAESWEIQDSGRTYVFHLRSDVFFHDHPAFPGGSGRKITAEDVRSSFDRIRDPRTASPGRWIFDHVLPGPEGFSGVDQSTFVIRLNRPFPPFLGILSMIYASVVPREVIKGEGADLRSHPVGSGPFKFFHWEEGVKLALQRNEKYYQKDDQGVQLPYLDAVLIGFVKDRNAEFLSLVKGELDMMSGADGGFLGELLDPLGNIGSRYSDQIRIARSPALATDYLGFLLDTTVATLRNSPWHDVRLRQALNFALDRERIISHLMHGIGSPARGILPPNVPGATGRGFDHDPQRARQLFAYAGFPGGKGLPPLTLTATASYLELCELIQHDLAAYGIKLIVDVVPLSTHKEGVANGDFIFFRKNWMADYPDAENFLLLFASANKAPDGPNYTRFSNADFDQAYEESLRTPNDSLRLELYQKMDSLIIDQAPAVFLLHPEVVRFTRKEISGLVADPMNNLDLRRVKKAS